MRQHRQNLLGAFRGSPRKGSKHSPSIAGLVVRLTGFGGGSGGCLTGWVGAMPAEDEDCAEEGVKDAPLEACVLAPADETVRRVFPAKLVAEDGGELEEMEEEEKEVAGLWMGVRGEPSMPGSGLELINHLGGIIDCLGGRGSRKVSLRAS